MIKIKQMRLQKLCQKITIPMKGKLLKTIDNDKKEIGNKSNNYCRNECPIITKPDDDQRHFLKQCPDICFEYVEYILYNICIKNRIYSESMEPAERYQ